MELNVQNQSEITLINDIILPLQPGKIIGIVGRGNSGKTALLETINYMIKARGISCSLVFQDDVFKHCLVSDEIGSRCKGKRMAQSLMVAGLSKSYLRREIDTLSDSEKQKLKLALALATNPRVLLIDDVLRAFDSKSRKAFIKLLLLMKNRYHRTIIVATTDTDFVHKVADEIFIIDNGILTVKGNKYEIFENRALLKYYDIKCPEIIEFSNIVKSNKNVEIGYRDNINDLIKDIYRYLR